MSWTVVNNALEKEWQFSSFSEAFAFMAQVAILAEKHNHHPDIFNRYNRVKLRLTTHDAGHVVTEKDEKLAEAINAVRVV